MTQATELIPYMRDVTLCERQLNELEFTWRLIETTAKMICPAEAKTILPSMAGTREAFAKLEHQLVAALATENLNKVVLDIGSKAQVVVDIVIRNLFERTADVGFLATDEDIRRFLRGDGVDREAIEHRLKEYIAKYSVYDEILVLSPDGQVLAHHDATNDVSHSADPLLAQTLASTEYVETFRRTDLCPSKDRALIYSRRIEDDAGQVLGVLCLSFRFDDEMESIFRAFRRKQDRSVMLLLDDEGVVIASSQEDHVAVGKRLPADPQARCDIIEFGGRDYIAKACRTTGYQGYMGLGWMGFVMVPVDAAFREPCVSEQVVVGGAGMLCEELRAIETQASQINKALRRVVWSGQVMSSGKGAELAKLKAVLQQVSETGERMRSVFSRAMQDLSHTVVSSSLHDLQFASHLMIDIMDRNLYERANDCRWWALSSEIREILGEGEVDQAGAQRIAAILDYINGLYTVYASLYVHDRHGRILAASDLHKTGLAVVGDRLDGRLLSHVGALHSTQDYCVSPFAPSPMYGGRPTYVYQAAIRHPHDEAAVVGGIGVVFDSETEFLNMLKGALPARAGVWAVFCDKAGHVIASTHPDIQAGQTVPLDVDMLDLTQGAGTSRVAQIFGQPHLVGVTMSSGYREYKNSGDYDNDVLALVALPLVSAELAAADRLPPLEIQAPARVGDGHEYATMLLHDRYLAVAVESVMDAGEMSALRSLGSGAGQIVGVIPQQNADNQTSFVPVLSLYDFFDLPHGDLSGQIIITRCRHGLLGLLVDELHEVLEFDGAAIKSLPDIMSGRFRWISQLISVNGGREVITAINPEAIYEMLRDKIKGKLNELESSEGWTVHSDSGPRSGSGTDPSPVGWISGPNASPATCPG